MDEFLSHTQALINHVYWFKQDLKVKPEREHIGSAINYTDITDREDDFLKELINTVTSWVYNKNKVKQIIDERLALTNYDYGNANAFLTTQAFSKFRPGQPQGQFGELLLFNFLQHFFKAIPLLRKQRITTSIGHERYGADAVHYRFKDSKNYVFLGESKCYESKYQFNTAFEKSLESICTTIKGFNKELDLYLYEDFLEPQLEDIAKKIKRGELANTHYELICLIAYNENKKITGNNEDEIKNSIKNIIEDRCCNVEHTCFQSIDAKILQRINYVIFPFWNLDNLLDNFQKKVGL